MLSVQHWKTGGVIFLEHLAWVSVWSEVQPCIWPNWYATASHYLLLESCFSKSRLVLPFWFRLTRVVPDKGPLNVCVCVRACVPVCWQLVPWWGYLIGRRLGGPSWRCVFNLVVVFLSDFMEFLMCYLNLKFVANTWSALTRTVSFGLIPFSHQRCPNVFRQRKMNYWNYSNMYALQPTVQKYLCWYCCIRSFYQMGDVG